MLGPLSDGSPLIAAASAGKLRLVRLLVEGGAQVNECNPRGETALLAVCKALRGEPAEPQTVKLLTYLLTNQADPNIQDGAGRTALMYACMARAGAEVASTLLAAGADPSMEDDSGASALVYAINAQHQLTLKVLMEACRARGRDIIIITTEVGESGGHVTRRYLNVPPSPDISPKSCMSPSDIVLKTGSPNSPEAGNIFNFRGIRKRGSGSPPPPRPRISSEPWLAIHNLACLNRAYQQGVRERNLQGGGDGEDLRREGEGEEEEEGEHFHQQRGGGRDNGEDLTLSLRPGGSTLDIKLPPCSPSPPGLRRNTLPSITVVLPPALSLPPLVNQSDALLRVPARSRSSVLLPHPPFSPASASRAPASSAFLPPLPVASSCHSERSRRSSRRHSVPRDLRLGDFTSTD